MKEMKHAPKALQMTKRRAPLTGTFDYIVIGCNRYPVAKVVKVIAPLVWVMCPYCRNLHQHRMHDNDDILTRLHACSFGGEYVTGRVEV